MFRSQRLHNFSLQNVGDNIIFLSVVSYERSSKCQSSFDISKREQCVRHHFQFHTKHMKKEINLISYAYLNICYIQRTFKVKQMLQRWAILSLSSWIHENESYQHSSPSIYWVGFLHFFHSESISKPVFSETINRSFDFE